MVEDESLTSHFRDWTWFDGRRLFVSAKRCLACAAIETVQRDFDRRLENYKPKPAIYAPGDGVTWRAEVIQREAVD